MKPVPTSRQQIHQLVDRLPTDALPDALHLLENLAQRLTPTAQEIELLSIIQRRLPTVQQTRWQELREQLESETLSDRDRQEFLTYSDLLEHWNAERVSAIATLAQLRQVDFNTLYAALTQQDNPVVG